MMSGRVRVLPSARIEERRVESVTQWGEGFAAGCVAAMRRIVDRSEWAMYQYDELEVVMGATKYATHQSNDG